MISNFELNHSSEINVYFPNTIDKIDEERAKLDEAIDQLEGQELKYAGKLWAQLGAVDSKTTANATRICNNIVSKRKAEIKLTEALKTDGATQKFKKKLEDKEIKGLIRYFWKSYTPENSRQESSIVDESFCQWSLPQTLSTIIRKIVSLFESVKEVKAESAQKTESAGHNEKEVAKAAPAVQKIESAGHNEMVTPVNDLKDALANAKNECSKLERELDHQKPYFYVMVSAQDEDPIEQVLDKVEEKLNTFDVAKHRKALLDAGLELDGKKVENELIEIYKDEIEVLQRKYDEIYTQIDEHDKDVEDLKDMRSKIKKIAFWKLEIESIEETFRESHG